ncbi:hypothetical protein ACFOU2_13030 [Bacillus songklensis]|uniref:Glycerophosphoryl diester phosphodiesterase membrane domain-containing protein n=1 Tax=Bacillus songklensis TaxID=1069116 RepID=A0ABV8B2A0_9BACI
MKTFKESFKLYTRNVEHIFLLSLTVLLPFFLFQTLIVNQVYIAASNTPFLFVGDITNSVYMLLFSIVTQLPFIQFALSDLEGEEGRLKKSYGIFLKYGFSMFLFGLCYVSVVLTGMLLFIIPGIIAAVLLFLTPYMTVMSGKPARQTWKVTFRLGKRKFFPIFLIVLLTALVEFMIGFVLMNMVATVTTSYLAIILSQAVVNMIIFPFVVIFTTLNVREWHDELVFQAK